MKDNRKPTTDMTGQERTIIRVEMTEYQLLMQAAMIAARNEKLSSMTRKKSLSNK